MFGIAHKIVSTFQKCKHLYFNMNQEDILKGFCELQAVAELMEEKARKFLNDCHKIQMLLEGVSTPSARKGLSEKEMARIIAKRRTRLKNANKKTASR